MRFSLCYRVVRLKGFFWGRRLFFYRRRFAGYLAPVGAGRQPRQWLWALGDGFWGTRGFLLTRLTQRYATAQIRGAGYALLRLLTPQLEPLWPMAWATVRFLLIRHYRGRRYRLGLPARGQRTHANAATTRRIRNAVVALIRERYWFQKLWEPRKRKFAALRPRFKAQSRRAAKAERHQRGVVRTKKKKDVWK